MQGGVFFEDFEILHIGDFNYQAPIDAGFNPIDIRTNSRFDNAEANGRDRVTDSTQFRNDNTRTEEQIALFGEISFAVTDALTLAIGARYYDLDYGLLDMVRGVMATGHYSLMITIRPMTFILPGLAAETTACRSTRSNR